MQGLYPLWVIEMVVYTGIPFLIVGVILLAVVYFYGKNV
jgi:hypothetical protein